MQKNVVLAAVVTALSFVGSCKSTKDDFHDNVCGAITASGGSSSAPTKNDLDKALTWAADHVTHSDLKKVMSMVRSDGIAKPYVAELLRSGGKEYASYDGECALADAFETAYPCPPDDPHHCGKDTH